MHFYSIWKGNDTEQVIAITLGDNSSDRVTLTKPFIVVSKRWTKRWLRGLCFGSVSKWIKVAKADVTCCSDHQLRRARIDNKQKQVAGVNFYTVWRHLEAPLQLICRRWSCLGLSEQRTGFGFDSTLTPLRFENQKIGSATVTRFNLLHGGPKGPLILEAHSSSFKLSQDKNECTCWHKALIITIEKMVGSRFVDSALFQF